MKKSTKILLSLPSVIGILYMFIFIYPTRFEWLIPDLMTYNTAVITINVLILISMLVLLRRIWKFENITTTKKSNWTWWIILFNVVAMHIYIWKMDDQFSEGNRKNAL